LSFAVSGFVISSIICVLGAAIGLLFIIFRVRLANAQGEAWDRRVGYPSKRRPGPWLVMGIFLIVVAVACEVSSVVYLVYEFNL
jgi:hypothetical protein